MSAASNAAELLQALIGLEERQGLFERTLLGVPYWHAVRNDVFQETLQALGIAERAHLRLEDMPARPLLPAKPAQWPEVARRSLWLDAERADLLVANHPRHLEAAGRYVCPYSQPLLDASSAGRVLLEGQFQGRYFHPSADETICYLDLALIAAHGAFRTRELCSRGFGARELGEIRALVVELERTLGAAPPFASILRRVRTAVLAMLGLTPLYERLLDRVQPKLVVEVIGYRLLHLVLTRVARRRGIPVAELQHGSISGAHAGYAFGQHGIPDSFPDYLLLFGSAWRDATPGLPLSAERTPAIGYAWLEQQRAAQHRGASRERRRILFLSQRAVGRELSKVAVELRRRTPAGALDIVYRLHPSEATGWREAYPELASLTGDGVVVETADARSLYASQADADTQVGVHTTALLEGIAFGVPSYVVALPGHEHMAAFTNLGLLRLVPDAAALSAALDDAQEPLSPATVERVWRPNPSQAFARFVASDLRCRRA
jgi:hypothetical protein